MRAVVLPLLDHEAALQLHSAVRHALQQVVSDDSLWYQDENIMHATLYHASTHGVGNRALSLLVQATNRCLNGASARHTSWTDNWQCRHPVHGCMCFLFFKSGRQSAPGVLLKPAPQVLQ